MLSSSHLCVYLVWVVFIIVYHFVVNWFFRNRCFCPDQFPWDDHSKRCKWFDLVFIYFFITTSVSILNSQSVYFSFFHSIKNKAFLFSSYCSLLGASSAAREPRSTRSDRCPAPRSRSRTQWTDQLTARSPSPARLPASVWRSTSSTPGEIIT